MRRTNMYTQEDSRYPIGIIFIELEGLLLQSGDAIPGTIEMLDTLVDGTFCIVLSSKSEATRDKTIQSMERMGFPVKRMEFHFRPEKKSTMNFRNIELENIKKKFLLGFGICLSEADTIPFDRCHYPTIQFSSTQKGAAYESSHIFEKVCHTWEEVGVFVLEMIQNITMEKLEQASGLLIAESSQNIE